MATTRTHQDGNTPELATIRKGRGAEAMQEFLPTPERLSQYLERNAEQVDAQLRSLEGRQDILDQLKTHEQDLREIYPNLDFDHLERELAVVGETLEEKQKFLEKVQAPEKHNMLRRAFDRVRGFAKKHPVVITLLVLSMIAAGVAGGFYLAGNLELLTTSLGVKQWTSGAAAGAKFLSPTTPPTLPLPSGGMEAIPHLGSSFTG